jgi:hypothetical protein
MELLRIEESAGGFTDFSAPVSYVVVDGAQVASFPERRDCRNGNRVRSNRRGNLDCNYHGRQGHRDQAQRHLLVSVIAIEIKSAGRAVAGPAPMFIAGLRSRIGQRRQSCAKLRGSGTDRVMSATLVNRPPVIPGLIGMGIYPHIAAGRLSGHPAAASGIGRPVPSAFHGGSAASGNGHGRHQRASGKSGRSQEDHRFRQHHAL